jgi:histidine kinase
VVTPQDYRTDYYSLGVCFYEVLAGELPFNTSNQTEMIYSHLARDSPKLVVKEPAVGNCLSEIIYKMMAKPPGDRYQSAEGIIADLEFCRSCLAGPVHTVEHYKFVPGRYDVSSVFKIPSKLYGREREYKVLSEAVEDAKVNKGVRCNGNGG